MSGDRLSKRYRIGAAQRRKWGARQGARCNFQRDHQTSSGKPRSSGNFGSKRLVGYYCGQVCSRCWHNPRHCNRPEHRVPSSSQMKGRPRLNLSTETKAASEIHGGNALQSIAWPSLTCPRIGTTLRALFSHGQKPTPIIVRLPPPLGAMASWRARGAS